MSARSPDPLALRAHGLTFDELESLRVYLEKVRAYAKASLSYYYDESSGGFLHRVDPGEVRSKEGFSKASTATCVNYLCACGILEDGPWTGTARQLADEILAAKWKSAGLPEGNPFTTAFLLEAIFYLLAEPSGVESAPEDARDAIRARLEDLNGALAAGEGGVFVAEYDPTAYLTQLVVRVLRLWSALSDESRRLVDTWTWNQLSQESVLLASGSPDADVFELAYCVLTASAVAPLDRMTPQQRGTLRYALDQFFARQNPDGTWPRSRPLFLYPNIGYAYCFDYELLVQLLADAQLRPFLFDKLGSCRDSAFGLDDKKYPLGASAFGWSSGHHGRSHLAESWSTASVLHFCFELQRVVAEAIRREVFAYAGADYAPPVAPPAPKAALPDTFLDSPVQIKQARHSLKRLVQDAFLQPLLDTLSSVAHGKGLPNTTPVSAILYGAPGTSKTQLAKMIAAVLGWPFLTLDPSHLTRNGLDQVHAEAHRLFGMLQSCDALVVLLDEFDELVREREEEGEIESRFLTTAMLPKLAALSQRRRIVYLLATNHLERFDAAIRRHGRFDMIIPVMPPTADAKIAKWSSLHRAMDSIAQEGEHGEQAARELKRQLAELTFLETSEFVDELKDAETGEKFAALLEIAHSTATLTQRTGRTPDSPTWSDRIKQESGKIRIPRIRSRQLRLPESS